MGSPVRLSATRLTCTHDGRGQGAGGWGGSGAARVAARPCVSNACMQHRPAARRPPQARLGVQVGGVGVALVEDDAQQLRRRAVERHRLELARGEAGALVGVKRQEAQAAPGGRLAGLLRAARLRAAASTRLQHRQLHAGRDLELVAEQLQRVQARRRLQRQRQLLGVLAEPAEAGRQGAEGGCGFGPAGGVERGSEGGQAPSQRSAPAADGTWASTSPCCRRCAAAARWRGIRGPMGQAEGG